MEYKQKKERNAMPTTFFTTLLQQIISNKLLLMAKNNFSVRFKLKPVTT